MSEFIRAPGSPSNVTITREAATLHPQTPGRTAFPLEATAADKFKSERLELDAAKNK